MRDKIMNFFAFAFLIWRADMADRKYLTAEEVSDRYRGAVSVATLRNWRAMRVGPAFVKIGKAVLYPIDELDAWDKRNMVSCRVLDD
jgi:Helix-turn-helix domain